MSKLLIVIPKKFPYGVGVVAEPFLESEVMHYEKFDKVVFFPCIKKNENYTKRKYSFSNFTVKSTIIPNFIIIKMFSKIFSKSFFYDFLLLSRTKKLNLKTIYQLLMFIYMGDLVYKTVKKWFKTEEQYDSIYVYSYWLHYNAYAAIRIKEKVIPDAFVFSRCHRFDIYEEVNKYNYIPLRKKLLDNLDVIVSISEDAKRYISKKYGIDYDSKVVISRLGASPNNYEVFYEKEKDVLKIISCSRLTSVKRVNRILEALMQISDFNIRWIHIGDGPEYEKLKSEAGKIKKKNLDINFMGNVSNADVYSIYAKNQFDVFVNVSKSEGIPVSIMEAMSFGIPVIATNVGGVSEIVKDNLTGYLLEENFTKDELVNKLIRIHNLSKNEMLKFRELSRKLFNEKYNSRKNYIEFIESIENQFR